MSLRFFCFPDTFCVAEPILQLDDASAVHYRLSFGVRGGFLSRMEDNWVVTMLFHDFPSVEERGRVHDVYRPLPHHVHQIQGLVSLVAR